MIRVTMTIVPFLLSGDDFNIGDKLIPNLWAFLAQFIAFLVMAILVIRFGYKPIHNYIQKRQEFIKNNLDKAQNDARDAEQANKQAQFNLNSSRKQASEILEEARKQAQDDLVKAEEDLKQEMAQKRKRAEEEIEAERKQALADMKDEMVDIALKASENLLAREVKEEDNRRLVDQFIDDLEEKSE